METDNLGGMQDLAVAGRVLDWKPRISLVDGLKELL